MMHDWELERDPSMDRLRQVAANQFLVLHRIHDDLRRSLRLREEGDPSASVLLDDIRLCLAFRKELLEFLQATRPQMTIHVKKAIVHRKAKQEE